MSGTAAAAANEEQLTLVRDSHAPARALALVVERRPATKATRPTCGSLCDLWFPAPL